MVSSAPPAFVSMVMSAPSWAPISRRSGWWPHRITDLGSNNCEACAASRPTAPSPTTTTVSPGCTLAQRTAWYAVGNTSVIGSTLWSCESAASDSGTLSSVPSAIGTRTNCDCPPCTAPSPGQKAWKPKQPPLMHEVCRPFLQKWHSPHEIQKGAHTLSPTFRPRTSAPTSSTTPTNSCPMRHPWSNPKASPWLRMCRSDPQIPALVTRTIASPGSRIVGSGTVSTVIFPLPSKTMPFMCAALSQVPVVRGDVRL